MDTIYFLLVIFLIITLAHLAFVTRFVVQIPTNLLFHIYCSENNKSNLETDIFRLILTVPGFISPVLIFYGYTVLPIENKNIDSIVLL
ncbi:hypothetical protein, partial [Flavobacterium sp.]|uniref:hypothetical protein n=1 Tax=Flavobacterium sp. TaxID=239 RepID=UPI003C49D966